MKDCHKHFEARREEPETKNPLFNELREILVFQSQDYIVVFPLQTVW